jgi:hypothetical protein
MVLWSICGSCQYWMNGRTSFVVFRALLGMLQGGFIPEVRNHPKPFTNLKISQEIPALECVKTF